MAPLPAVLAGAVPVEVELEVVPELVVLDCEVVEVTLVVVLVELPSSVAQVPGCPADWRSVVESCAKPLDEKFTFDHVVTLDGARVQGSIGYTRDAGGDVGNIVTRADAGRILGARL